MKKRLLSLVLALLMLCTMLPVVPLTVDAATELSVSPNPKVEYGYTSETPVGTIRYICQDSDNETYFFWDYWPNPPFGLYESPKSECSTACISMALSYVGVNTTPYEILMYKDGETWAKTDWGGTTYNVIGSSASAISEAMDKYINGNGKYSPLVIHLKPYPSSGGEHHVVLAGKISNDSYLVIDPWSPETYTLTVSNGNVSNGSNTYPIKMVHQWYNPNATPPVAKTSYPAYCALQVSASETYLKTMPCSRESDPNSDDVMKLEKDAPLLATQLVQNKYDNLWYKVETMTGEVGYVYAGDTKYIDFGVNDITAPGVTVPANHTQSSTYILSGAVKSIGNRLTNISVYVYSGTNTSANPVTGHNVDVNLIGRSYSLGGSLIDANTCFDQLPAGKYTYVVSASYENYYAVSAKKLSEPNKGTEELYKATFNVTSGAVSCSHSYTGEVTTAATCVKNGIRTYTCSKCGHSYTETIAATGIHNYVGKVTADAYCGGTGTKTYTCTGCSASYTETIPATGSHTWGGWGVRTAATCTASGVKARKCPVCYQEETQIIPATGHAFGDWVTTTAPGCSSTGTQKKTCAYCGAVQSNLLYPTGHTYGEWVTTIAVGCTTDGMQEKTCSSCGNVQIQQIFATGHSYVSERIPDDENGPERICYTCSACGDTYSKVVEYVTTGECGKNLLWKLDADGVLTIWGTGDMHMSVQQPWYSYISQIKAVVVKYGVTSIDNDAFKGCGNLSTVTLSDSVSSIGSCAFEGCSSLTSITIPEGVTSISDGAFAYCSSLTSITIPEGVTSIGDYAFYQCRGLTNITVPKSLTGKSATKAFFGSGIRSLNYQGTVAQWLDGYTSIGNAFDGIRVQCTDKTISATASHLGWCGDGILWYLTNDGILTIDGTGAMTDYESGNAPWKNLSSAIKSVVISEGITGIGEYSFCNLKAVKTISIPDSCETIGDYAFKGCMGIQSVDIPQKVTSIGHQAFYGCSALSTITLPVSVETLGRQAFKASADTVRVDYAGSVAQWRTLVDGSKSIYFEGNAQIYCNGEKLADDILYMGTAGEHVEWVLSDTGVLTVTGDGPMVSEYEIRIKYGEGAYDWYDDCTGAWAAYDTLIKNVIIEEGVTSISRNAFINLPALVSVSIPSSVATIEEQAFQGCVSLKEVNIEEGVTEIKYNAFKECSALESFDVPASVSTIGYDVFYKCTKLQTVIFAGSNIKSLSRGLFEGCVALQNVELPESLKTLGYGTFLGCTSLKTLHIPNSLKECSYEAFGYTVGITSFSVNPDNPYYTCEDGILFNKAKDTLILYPQGRTDSSYYIPDTVTTIAEEAFYGNPYLEKVYIPDAISVVGDKAFFECTNLKGAYFMGGYPDEEGYDVFKQAINGSDYDYENLPNIVIYYLEDEYYNGWFGNCYEDYKKETWEYEILEYTVTGGKIYIESVTGIITDADPSVTAAEIPSQINGWTITAIEESAFEECSNLVRITIPESVTSIGDRAFRHCSSLSSFTIPENVNRIGNNAFAYCTSLNSITIPDSVTSIGASAFWGCSSLTSIMIPDSVTSIGDWAFEECSSLTNVYITDISSWCEIDFCEAAANPLLFAKNLYLNNVLVTELIIPDGVTSIGDYAFYNYNSLTAITIPSSVTSIGDYSFGWCSGINDVYYDGTAEQWVQISIGDDNWYLTGATIHYPGSELTGIAIKIQPTKIEYWVGESLDTTGLTLTATYSDGSTQEITEGFSVTGYDSELVGEQQVTVTYEGFTATFTVLTSAAYTPGDINGDRIVDNKDVTRLFQYVSEWDVEVVEAALDVNGDGIVDNKDVTRLFQYVSEWNVQIH